MAPYQARRFQNPYFKAKIKLPAWPLILIGFGLGLFIALTSFFFTAPLFVISSIRIEGAETINPKEIREVAETYLSKHAFLIFKNNNRFLFDEKTLSDLLEDRYSFSALEIEREKQTLAIILKEKVSSFLWLTGETSYLLDENGLVIRAITAEETATIASPPLLQGPTRDGTLIPETIKILVFRDLTNKPVEIGETVLSEDEVHNVRTFFEAVYPSGVVIERFDLNREIGAWLKAATREGFDILFDPSQDVLPQADNVILLLRDQIKDRSSLEYLDVRFGDHLYYK